MQEFSKFLVTYWKEILLSICSVIFLISSIFKRKITCNDFYSFCDELFSQIGLLNIQIAEQHYSDGAEKKAFVIALLMRALKRRFVLNEKQERLCEAYFSGLIEQALKCPQKKD